MFSIQKINGIFELGLLMFWVSFTIDFQEVHLNYLDEIVKHSCWQCTKNSTPLLHKAERDTSLFSTLLQNSKLTSHCPSVSKNWKLLSHTPGSVFMWTPMHWLCLSQSSLFILPTLLRRLRGSPASLPPHTGRMVLMFWLCAGHATGPRTPRQTSPTPDASSVSWRRAWKQPPHIYSHLKFILERLTL